MRPLTWEYLAGFTDADGYITSQMGGRYVAAIRIGWVQMTSARWQLEEIQKFLDSKGVISYLGDEKPYRGSSASRLRVSREASVRIVLKALIPHLVLKRERAEDAIRELDERLLARRLMGKNHRL